MSTRVPSSNATVSYAYTVKNAVGVIGNLQGFNPSADRELERVRQLSTTIQDEDCVEIIPGRSAFQITVDRFETFNQGLAAALHGATGVVDISQQQTPFNITETITNSAGGTRTIQYIGCWIKSVQKTIQEGKITVSENAVIWVTSISVI